MNKLLFAAAAVAVAAGTATTPVVAQDSPHSLSANIGLFSQYIFRGTSQTTGEPAVQGGIDYANANGIYVGTWASNVSWLQDFGAYTRSSMEWDFYGGWKKDFGNDVSIDLGTIYYYYPGKVNAGFWDADTWELYAGIGWKFLGFKYSYALTDYFGARPSPSQAKTDGTQYFDFYANYAFGDSGFAINAHYGILDVKNDGSQAAGTEASYNDWKIGVTYVVPSGLVKDFEFGAYYTDTDVKNNAAGTSFWVDGTGYNTAKAAFVAYVKKSF